ncbi:MAG: hypothetical protein ABH812_02375 [bacterium]
MKNFTRFYKPILLSVCFILLLYITFPSLNPLDNRMFNFHDITQAGRINEFVLNLSSGKIPPRLAPEFSFNQGFPLFNFYAPFAYWIAALIYFLGVSVIGSLKLSFFLAFVLSFFTMLWFLRKLFDFIPSLLGATLYVTSTYFATEIMIRGNLAEVWYLALLPLVFSLLITNSKIPTRRNFFLTTIILFFTFTVHNIFSLLSVLIFIGFALLLPNKKSNILAIMLSLLLGSYFLLPALTETSFTQIKSLIKSYSYQDHFLCAWQLWKSNGWNFGSSLPGCGGDQLSFKLGKLNLILGLLGLLFLFFRMFIYKHKNTIQKISLFIGFLFVFSLFLTLSYSNPIWDLFSPVMALFQFPWRFLIFGMVGVAFFGAYFFHFIKIPFKNILMIIIIIVSFVTARKYLIKPMYSYAEYNTKYNSNSTLTQELAFMMPEYISANTNYGYWSSFDPALPSSKSINFNYSLPVETKQKIIVEKNSHFEKRVSVLNHGKVIVNVQYFPFWKIYINNKQANIEKFDKLGRPILQVDKPSTILIRYEQTPIEKTGNSMTIFGFLLLFIIVYKRSVYEKII